MDIKVRHQPGTWCGYPTWGQRPADGDIQGRLMHVCRLYEQDDRYEGCMRRETVMNVFTGKRNIRRPRHLRMPSCWLAGILTGCIHLKVLLATSAGFLVKLHQYHLPHLYRIYAFYLFLCACLSFISFTVPGPRSWLLSCKPTYPLSHHSEEDLI